MVFNEGTLIVLLMHFSLLFLVKYIVRRVMEMRKSRMLCFSCRSLLLSTIVLNNNNNRFIVTIIVTINRLLLSLSTVVSQIPTIKFSGK